MSSKTILITGATDGIGLETAKMLVEQAHHLLLHGRNPGSLLGSKMVKEGFGMEGKDLSIGAEILVRAALSDDFTGASGKYFDNDSGKFANPHPDALDEEKCQLVLSAIEKDLI